MSQKLSEDEIKHFQNTVIQYYSEHGRELPWRKIEKNGLPDPYHILVSEVMLQQTQVVRVIPKFEQFLSFFPTINSLATAPLSSVLKQWSGLGYNRRAKFLHEAAISVTSQFTKFPDTLDQLVSLPGIGPNTAAAILVYSFNLPMVYIETNIRTVYIHHFFDQSEVLDQDITVLIEQTLHRDNPRLWYWALMDYGSYLKATNLNPSRRSKHHKIQSKFVGSRRQIRGQVLKLLSEKPLTYTAIQKSCKDTRLKEVVRDLVKEGLIHKKNQTYYLGK